MSTPQALSNALKGLMRRVPQPVSIATVKIDTPFPHYHGATLSSLTSVALAPLPLVAFSLRLPSRLAAAIGAPASSAASSSPSAPSGSTPSLPKEANIVLHYLSSSQTPLAASFAKALPALTPAGGASSSPPGSAASPFALHPFSPSAEGIPVLGGCIGAISCRVLGSVPLSAVGLGSVGFSAGSLGSGSEGWDGEATSELYVAEVVRVEESLPLPPLVEAESDSLAAGHPPTGDLEAGKGLPLVYHDQRYCGVGDIGRT